MARPLRFHAPGLLYHVMARGNARMPIFLDDRDHHHFLDILGEVSRRYGLRCWAYCLMANHYHLVADTTHDNLSLAMRQLNGVYAQWWNRRHDRVGHVTQGRFKAQVVQEDRYLLAVCRYVLLNPVRAGLVARPSEWPWSSCAATLGAATPLTFFDPDLLLDACGGDSLAARRAAVRRLLTAADLLDVASAVRRDKRVIGDDAFVDGFRRRASTAPPDVPQRDRMLSRPSLSLLLLDSSGGTLQMRLANATEWRYSVTEIAAALGMSRPAVDRLLKSAPLPPRAMPSGRPGTEGEQTQT